MAFEPAHLRLGIREIRRRAAEGLEELRSCAVCPRNCAVDRLADQWSFCKIGRHAVVSSAFPHFGEEDCLRGWQGSGTIFFSMCNLKCVFCLLPDTNILTDRGMRRIEEIFLGAAPTNGTQDGQVRALSSLQAWTHTGRLAPVSKAFRHTFSGELVVIKPYGLSPISLTANHTLYVANSNLESREVRAEEVTKNEFLLVPRPIVDLPAPTLDARLVLTPFVRTYRKRGLSVDSWNGVAGGSRVHYRKTPHAFWVPIRSITRRGYDGYVYNLEIDHPDHSYMANGVAVGNCQNADISQQKAGREASAEGLARLMIALQDQGCHNINLVTPEHVVPQILEALPIAIDRGLRLPIVYNTGAYDSMRSLQLLDGIVDIYMPDFKLWDRERSRLYLKAPDYPDVARRTIKEMHRQVGPLQIDASGLARRGVLIRHLVMPGAIADTREIMRWIATELGSESYVNVMAQYRPAGQVGKNPRYEVINRRIRAEEYDAAVQAAINAGLSRLDRWVRGGPGLPLFT